MKKSLIFLSLFSCFSVLAQSPTARRTPVVLAVQRVLPSVINIATEEVIRVSDPFEAFFNDFFSGPVHFFKRSIPLGSGVVVDARGLAITNYHVVRRASNIDLRLLDGTLVRGRLVAYDAPNDLALLKFAPPPNTPLQAIPMAYPHDLLLGETVIAVGNPFGLGNSVTTGVLSAIDRQIEEEGVVFDDILQTDAAINPGNSGGPLINLDGELIGLNLAIRRDAEGIGFAVPLARIETVIAQWLVPSRFSNGFLGLVPSTLEEADGTCVQVDSVVAESSAEKSGLRPGDIIETVNGEPVSSAFQLGCKLWALTPGDTVVLGLRDLRPATLTVQPMEGERLVRQRIGVEAQTLTDPLRQAMGLPDKVTGVTVSEVEENGPAAKLGLGRGDVIMGVNGQQITGLGDLTEALHTKRGGDTVQLEILVTRQLYGELLIRPVTVRMILN